MNNYAYYYRTVFFSGCSAMYKLMPLTASKQYIQ